MAERRLRWRSVLFTPATRPDRVGRLSSTAADVTVLDLEDAVPVGEKDPARDGLAAFASALRRANPDLVVLARVNPLGSPWFAADVAAAASAGVAGVVLPKATSPGDALAVSDAWASARPAPLDERGAPGTSAGEANASGAGAGSGRAAQGDRPMVMAGIETAAGVDAATSILAGGGFAAAYFGAEDYIADVGGRRTEAGTEVLYARSRVAMAAAIGGVDAVDQVVVRYSDADAFAADASAARDLGYRGKLCIHPDQVALAHEAFTPSAAEVARATALLFALRSAGGGVATFEGQMIDAPAVRAAEAVLALGGASV